MPLSENERAAIIAALQNPSPGLVGILENIPQLLVTIGTSIEVLQAVERKLERLLGRIDDDTKRGEKS